MEGKLKINHFPKGSSKIKKGDIVALISDLPLGYGNKKPVPKGAEGYCNSDGFVAGLMEVTFKLPKDGVVHATFNSEQAREYLALK